MTMTQFIAGLLFAAARTMPMELSRSLPPEQWADLVDGEHDLYLTHLGPDGAAAQDTYYKDTGEGEVVP
jgi:hypothetical protein